MYLVDTNVWIERLLDQERAEEVKRFLDSVSSDQLSITDFSFHSIGVILSRLNRHEGLLRFVQDTLIKMERYVYFASVPQILSVRLT